MEMANNMARRNAFLRSMKRKEKQNKTEKMKTKLGQTVTSKNSQCPQGKNKPCGFSEWFDYRFSKLLLFGETYFLKILQMSD